MIILGTNSIKDTGYEVANSVRMNRGDSPSFTRSVSSNGDFNNATLSMWVKKCSNGIDTNRLWLEYENGTNYEEVRFRDDDTLRIYSESGGGTYFEIITNRKFRDVSAFYHICVIYDYSQSTSTDRIKLFINGTRETSFSTYSVPSQGGNSSMNKSGNTVYVGAYPSGSNYFDGYLAECVWLDGTSASIGDFGEFDSDTPSIWKPKDVSGLTAGTNGWYMDFEDSSNLGNDVFGGTDFTENNLAATDQCTDTPTNNFATLNPLEPSPNAITFSEGNTVEVGSGGNGGRFVGGTIAVGSGKWWCEMKVTVNGSYPIIGIIDSRSSFKMNSAYFVDGSQTTQNRSGYALFTNSDIYNNGDDNFGDFGTTFTTGDIIGVGLNLDASPPTLTFQKNGSNEVSVDVEVPPSGFYTFPAIGGYYASAKAEVNFGNSPFSISSGVADANGYGAFEYAPKSGYYALCTKNLAEYG